MKLKPIITIYEDFLKDYQKINAWIAYECFPIKNIPININKYTNQAIIEVTYIGTQGNNNKYESLSTIFESSLSKYICFLSKRNITLFIIGESALKNRVRSYKGLFNKEIEKKYYLEKEVNLDNKYSVIIGIVKMDETTFDFIKKHLFDQTKCFLLISENNIFSEDFLIDCFQSTINRSSMTVNYLSACEKYCTDNNIIIRETGDGGDQEFSWQLFVNKKNANNLKLDLEKLLDN